MKKRLGPEGEAKEQTVVGPGTDELHKCKHKKGCEVHENQAARSAVKVGKGERTGAKPWHRSQQVKTNRACVSWAMRTNRERRRQFVYRAEVGSSIQVRVGCCRNCVASEDGERLGYSPVGSSLQPRVTRDLLTFGTDCLKLAESYPFGGRHPTSILPWERRLP